MSIVNVASVLGATTVANESSSCQCIGLGAVALPCIRLRHNRRVVSRKNQINLTGG